MIAPLPTQMSGARWLAARRHALLADQPRVGKTGTAIIGADLIEAENVLIVTTASGRGVWRKGVETWQRLPRRVQVLAEGSAKLDPRSNVAIVGWGGITTPNLRAELLSRPWDLVIGDESHNAINFETARTQCFHGHLLEDEKTLVTRGALAHTAPAAWLLSGTPIPDNPFNLYPTFKSLFPELLLAKPALGWPDVSEATAFRDRYCVTYPKKIGWQNYVRVFVRGQHLDELKARIAPVLLLRTQQDVGIAPPEYGFFPISIDERLKSETFGNEDAAAIIEAAEKGVTKDLELHLGPLRRITGELKARALLPLLDRMFRDGLDKVVLMCWHKDTMRILRDGLAHWGVTGIDGSTTPKMREAAERAFQTNPSTRVFVGQITAAGEAIDLSASALLLFVEMSFRPKDGKQAGLRITNHGQTRPAKVQVCVIPGSIDESLSAILLRKVTAIREVLH